jgi:hypothetical protein
MFECDVAAYLSEHNVSFKYEPEKIAFLKELRNGECQDCGSTHVGVLANYLPDFVLANGIYIEAKGRFTSKDRTKTLAILASNNELTRENYRMLFMQNKHTTVTKKETYLDWCDRHEIIAAVGPSVPEEWMK